MTVVLTMIEATILSNVGDLKEFLKCVPNDTALGYGGDGFKLSLECNKADPDQKWLEIDTF